MGCVMNIRKNIGSQVLKKQLFIKMSLKWLHRKQSLLNVTCVLRLEPKEAQEIILHGVWISPLRHENESACRH